MTKGIYCIRNSVTGERYIGSSVNVEARWLIHKTHLSRKSHHSSKLQSAWNKYGRGNFVLEIIEQIVDSENKTLTDREQYWITHYDSYKRGYNSTPIASRRYTLTDEERDLRAELIRYGLYEPKYIQQVKSQNPLNYDQERQRIWEEKFKAISKSRSRYVLLGRLFFAIVMLAYFALAAHFLPSLILFLPIAIWPILWASFMIGTSKRQEWKLLKNSEPRAIAQQKQDELIKIERGKRKRYRIPRGKFA